MLKKGAMFGKLSQLDRFKFNRGAMFGLDARIALAIFGALSVISGAALYSAIQDSKVTAIITELEEYSKAYQAYLLDVGSSIGYRENAASTVSLKTIELLKSSKPGWAGPYLPYSESDMLSYDLEHSIGIDKYNYIFYIKAVADSSFGSLTNGSGIQSTCVGNDTKCSIWVGLANVGSLDIATKIDEKVDGELSANSGRIRIRLHNSSQYAVYYEIMPDLEND